MEDSNSIDAQMLSPSGMSSSNENFMKKRLAEDVLYNLMDKYIGHDKTSI